MTIGVVAVAVWFVLLSHRSDDPFASGYSLFYLLCLFFAAVAALFVAVLFRRFRLLCLSPAGIGLPLFALAVLVEVGDAAAKDRNPCAV